MKRSKLLLTIILWLLQVPVVYSQNAPRTALPNLAACASELVNVPVTVSDFANIGAISLTLKYDPAVLVFLGFTPNESLPANFIIQAAVPGTAIASGFITGSPGITLSDGAVLFTLRFTFNGGTTGITWDDDNGTSCEYATYITDPPGFNALNDKPEAIYYVDGSVGEKINIILLKNTNCGEFIVKLKPLCQTALDLTKIIFTISWPAVAGSDVQTGNVAAAWPGLVQLGNREIYDNKYYVTFSSSTTYPVNWDANSENTIMTFTISGTGEGNADFTVITDDYNNIDPGLNTAWYIEAAAMDETGSITNNAKGVSLNCGLYLKDFLQGAYNASTDLMRTDLKVNGYLPLMQPYGSTVLAYDGPESVISFTAPVVDWVLIELRSGSAADTKIASQAALLLENGHIVGADQVNPPVFREIIPGDSYFVVVYHRNHLSVMTPEGIILPNISGTRHDFTISPPDNVYGAMNGVVLLETGVYGQICGDINMDNKLIYSGMKNDRGLVISKIGSLVNPVYLNSTINGYYAEDLNMNGQIKYSGGQNDPSLIFTNIDFFTTPTYLNTIYSGVVPVNFTGSLPESQSEGTADFFTGQNKIDFGIFATMVPGRIEIRIKPNFSEDGARYLTNAQFTVKWPVSNGASSLVADDPVHPFLLTQQGSPFVDGGFYYQVWATPGGTSISWPANQEILIQAFTCISPECVVFEIAHDSYVQNTINGDYYIEVNGIPDLTGSLYNPSAWQAPLAPGIIMGADSVQAGVSGLVYSVAPVTFASYYRWNFTGIGATINGTGNSVIISFSPGATSGNLTVTGQNGCGEGPESPPLAISLLSGSSFVINSAGNLKFNEIRIYPNPSSGRINLDFPHGSDREAVIEICSVHGGIQNSCQFSNRMDSGQTTVLDVSVLPAGFYLVRIRVEGEVYTGKFIRN